MYVISKFDGNCIWNKTNEDERKKKLNDLKKNGRKRGYERNKKSNKYNAYSYI